MIVRIVRKWELTLLMWLSSLNLTTQGLLWCHFSTDQALFGSKYLPCLIGWKLNLCLNWNSMSKLQSASLHSCKLPHFIQLSHQTLCKYPSSSATNLQPKALKRSLIQFVLLTVRASNGSPCTQAWLFVHWPSYSMGSQWYVESSYDLFEDNLSLGYYGTLTSPSGGSLPYS